MFLLCVLIYNNTGYAERLHGMYILPAESNIILASANARM